MNKNVGLKWFFGVVTLVAAFVFLYSARYDEDRTVEVVVQEYTSSGVTVNKYLKSRAKGSPQGDSIIEASNDLLNHMFEMKLFLEEEIRLNGIEEKHQSEIDLINGVLFGSSDSLNQGKFSGEKLERKILVFQNAVNALSSEFGPADEDAIECDIIKSKDIEYANDTISWSEMKFKNGDFQTVKEELLKTKFSVTQFEKDALTKIVASN